MSFDQFGIGYRSCTGNVSVVILKENKYISKPNTNDQLLILI